MQMEVQIVDYSVNVRRFFSSGHPLKGGAMFVHNTEGKLASFIGGKELYYP